MHPGVSIAFALTAASAAVAVAATEPPSPPAKEAGATVSELVVAPDKLLSELEVMAPKACLPVRRNSSAPTPHVVSTYPPQSGKVRPGLLIVRVTFDRPMTCSGFLASDSILPDPCPGERQVLRQSYDRRTVWTVCQLRAHQQFGLWLNPNRVDAGVTPNIAFQSLEGRPVMPYRLVFATTEGPMVTTAADALSQDPETSSHQKH